MAKEICISTTPHETRLAILEDDQLTEIYYERENEYTLAGSIYKGKVTRVLPGMQSSFVDVGLERDAFLYVTDFLEDQEDSEDYETSSAGSAPKRISSGDRQPAEEASAVAPSEEPRRGRRDGRRGERGRGERPAERAPEKPETVEAPPRMKASEERAAAAAALRVAQPTDTDRDEKGDEETPEGTRRWRGRRGRRRGGMRAGVLGAAKPEDEAGSLPAMAAEMPEHGAPGGLIAVTPADENVAGAASQGSAEPEVLELQAAASPRRDQEGGRSRGRREREPRVRDRSGEQSAESTREQERTPRAAEHVTSSAAPSAATTVLPGESLSKYGSAPAASIEGVAAPAPTAKLALPTRPVNYVAPRPTTQVEVLSGWDGGSVLPGETLSRYKGPAATPTAPVGLDEVAAEAPVAATHETAPTVAADHSEMALEAAPEALLTDNAETREQQVQTALAAAETSAPETVAEALPGTVHGEYITTAAEPIDGEKQTADAVEEIAGSEMAAAEQHDAPGATEPAEYEPEDGTASVRLSTPTSNELRLSRFFGGGEPAASTVPDKKEVEPAQPAPQEAAVAKGETEQPGQDAHHDAHQEESTRTTLEAGSEAIPTMMLDAAVPVAETHEPEAQEQVDRIDRALPPAFAERFVQQPIAGAEEDHEEYVEHPHEAIARHDGDGFTELVDQLQGFAPGSGLLEEEEVIDEDEYDFDPIHLHADELDLEELEEETLSGDESEDEPASEQRPAARMEDPRENDEEDEDEDAGAFALEEVEDDEDEAAPMAAGGEPQRQERTGEDRAKRGGRNSGRRRGGPGSGGNGGGGRRQSAQTQDLPIISDLLKQGQEILVQIAKEPIAKKGARITSHIALPGRFLVFMPTVNHVGVSRKISSDEERQRLKRILISEKGESSGGFIVRTAAENASEEELRADLRFLISLWTEIKQRSETAKAPALIYHDLNLVERILRDQVSSNFSTIWVDTEQEYERIVRFLNRFQPSLVRRVKLYTKETPLFEHFGIQEEISKALKSKVWLKSGGSIVINQTEALVAIDINTGKYVGKTARLEDTIVKTNLDAIPEIVRQIRLRDLGGIIVIDFIDMDERKNRHKVLAALEEAMKVDRAPSKVLQFNDFGLVAITRKRVKQSLERTLSVTCETCAGTGMVKSPITVCNEIFIELRKMQKHLDGKDVMLRVNPEVVKQLKSGSGKWINEYEEIVGKTIIIKSDPSLHPEQFDIH